jgi:mono/diheme cytochrome c family protein
MKGKVAHWLVIVSIVGLAACQNAQDPVARGEAYFNGMGCIKCHSMGDKGVEWGPDLTTIGFRKTPEWLHLWLKNPHAWRKETVMPSFNLNEATRNDLVAYLSAQKGQAWKNGRPWNTPELKSAEGVARGEKLFTKAGCVACHAEKGRGGYPNNNVVGGQIPSLAKVSEGYTKDELKAKIRGGVISDPADPSQPHPMIFMPKWGDMLEDDELDAVADYLISLGKSSSGGKAKKDEW